MDRKEITKDLSNRLEKYLNPKNDPRIYMAKEVTFDYSTKTDHIRVDYMKFVLENNSISGIENGKFYCYEIKSCMADYESGHGLNFIGEYNNLVMTNNLYKELLEKKGEIYLRNSLYRIGILVSDGDSLRCVKKAGKVDRRYPLSMMLLMMFRSNQRDLMKLRKEQ